jgi:hypothetical protein
MVATLRTSRPVRGVVQHFGNGVLLLSINDPWKTLEASLPSFEPGFKRSREQADKQRRLESEA